MALDVARSVENPQLSPEVQGAAPELQETEAAVRDALLQALEGVEAPVARQVAPDASAYAESPEVQQGMLKLLEQAA